ncbi:hypothetical protein [Kibdelosporangium phytohabitans]|uniref:Uncharacterized protein n=1 Tax=Kibdelosporangium phytohabitans TaxID=860235 RepID=A0A0N9HVY5_9PSEU|nr:hypothetical protein [Kibdelosporangium phytohabitans]ALG05945.1 hypothetical protein AOZ06_02540 [Kibdelosporangium phytohabitans]MBE1466003.1 hypothetical protein [Kibdelosporangium phytohabitans]
MGDTMPDGSQQPVDPRSQRASEKMDDWNAQHPDGGGGWLGGIFSTVNDMMAAANAGAFAISPDVANEVVKQLTKIQDQVAEMKMTGFTGFQQQRLGGGYATDVATFNMQVNQEGPGKLLDQFNDQLIQLKAAVSRSIDNYTRSDGGNSKRVDGAGGGL